MRRLLVLLTWVCLSGMPSSVSGQTLPALNLGFTSFMDGAPPSGPGLYVSQYLNYYSANRLNDSDGNPLRLPDPKLRAASFLTQIIYLSKFDIGGIANPGLDVLIPAASLDLNYSQPGMFPTSSNGGLGDILIGPALQFNPIMNSDGNPIFVHRLEAQFIIPTGQYDRRNLINAGSNFFSFEPYWAGTLFLGPKWAASYRAHYLWNSKNNDPWIGFRANNAESGQAFHTNFTLDREMIEKKLRVGLNGYWLVQTTNSKLDGVPIPGRERALAIGPGALLSFSKDSFLFVNYYFETFTENRPEGSRLNVRFVHHF